MKKLGIESDEIFYILCPKGELGNEYTKLENFLFNYKKHYARACGINVSNVEIKFINWGTDALVFVLINKAHKTFCTLVVNQPELSPQELKNQFELAKKFSKIESSIIAPTEFFESDGKALINLPYLMQAKCISCLKGKLGVYVPEPNYHFEEFSEKEKQVIDSCIIAKLVASFNHKKQQGLADVRLIMGDFVLDRNCKADLSLEKLFEKTSLIACRKVVNCSFLEYVNLLKTEFSAVSMNNERNYQINPNNIINTLSSTSMTPQSIQKGIDFAQELTKNNLTSKKL